MDFMIMGAAGVCAGAVILWLALGFWDKTQRVINET